MEDKTKRDLRRFYAETVDEQLASGTMLPKANALTRQHQVLAKYGITGATADALLAEISAATQE